MLKKKKVPDYQIIDQSFWRLPRLFFKLMGAAHANEKVLKDSREIPASFWQFLLTLWMKLEEDAWLSGTHREISITARQFGVNKNRAATCVHLLGISGLFTIVQWGVLKKRGDPGAPTLLKYLDGSESEWWVFIEALAEQLRFDRENHRSHQTPAGFKSFLVDLAGVVDAKRAEIHLPPANAEYLYAADPKNPRPPASEFPDLDPDTEGVEEDVF